MISTSEFSDALAAPALVTPKNEEPAAGTSPAPATTEGSLPTQPSVSLDSLAIAYVIVLQSLAETLFEHTSPSNGKFDSIGTVRRRLEVCAAVWAANRAALEASTLSIHERAHMLKLVWQRVTLHWKEFCTSNGEISGWVEKRAAEYLQDRDRSKTTALATHIVEEFLDAIEIEEPARSTQLRVLSSLVCHRIVSDVTHFNELKSRYRFV